MGIPTENFVTGQNIAHFNCAICSEVIEDALVIKNCDHMFCNDAVFWESTFSGAFSVRIFG